jgi:PAS domain S-box-containing protein
MHDDMSSLSRWPWVDGECAGLLRSTDWRASPLGPPDGWPAPLRAVVQTMLASAVPMYVVWGPSLCLLYNDAYVQVLGPRPTSAVGRGWSDVWPEFVGEVLPLLERVMQGETVTAHDAPFTIERGNGPERAWFDFTVSPLRNEEGALQGGLCVCSERTADVLRKQDTQERLTLLSDTLKQAPCFVAVLRAPDWKYAFENPAHVELHGRSVLGWTVGSAFGDGAAQEVTALMERVRVSGETLIERNLRLVLKDRVRYATVAFQPLLQGGERVGVVMLGFDVTEAEQAQQELAQSEARFQAITDAMPQLVFAGGAEGNTYVNGRYSEFVGVPPDQLLGHAWASFLHPEDRSAAVHAWSEAVEAGGAYETNLRIRRADGEYRWMLARALPVKDASGSVTQWMGTCTDIDETKRMEEELETARRRIASAMVAGDIAIVSWDVQRDLVVADENLTRLFGLPEDAARGANSSVFLAAVHPEDLPHIQAKITAALKEGELLEDQYRVRRPEGGWRTIQSRGRVDRDAEGRALWVSSVLMDISELMAAQDALRAADKRKDEFLAMLAHELRNPLAPIVSAAALLPRLTNDSNRVTQMAQVIARQARHLTGLVDDLLDVSRVTRGQVQLDREPLALNSVLAEALEQVQPVAASRMQVLSRTVPAQKIYVLGDAKRLVQVFVNILQNASKYTLEHGRISVSVSASRKHVAVRVEDNGIGMSPELCGAAFDLFVQGERRPDRSQGGLGIGLALVKSLVALHGGTVSASSEGPGKGSTFVVELPRVEAPKLVEPTPELDFVAGKGSVLVVDDNEDAAALLAMMLEDAGYRVWVRHTPSEALELVRQVTPQVCLLDIGLPEFDGYTLAGKLVEAPGLQDVRLAAISGYAQPSDIGKSQAAGFDMHFAKPVDPSALTEWLASLELSSPA